MYASPRPLSRCMYVYHSSVQVRACVQHSAAVCMHKPITSPTKSNYAASERACVHACLRARVHSGSTCARRYAVLIGPLASPTVGAINCPSRSRSPASCKLALPFAPPACLLLACLLGRHVIAAPPLGQIYTCQANTIFSFLVMAETDFSGC